MIYLLFCATAYTPWQTCIFPTLTLFLLIFPCTEHVFLIISTHFKDWFLATVGLVWLEYELWHDPVLLSREYWDDEGHHKNQRGTRHPSELISFNCSAYECLVKINLPIWPAQKCLRFKLVKFQWCQTQLLFYMKYIVIYIED